MLEQVYELMSNAGENSHEELLSSFRDKKIILYGAGGLGTLTSDVLKKKGYQPVCFIDDDPEKQNTTVNGLTVLSPRSVDRDGESVFLICVPQFAEAADRLIRLGHGNVRHFPLVKQEEGFYDASLIKDNWERILDVYGLLADEYSAAVYVGILKHRLTMDFSHLDRVISQNQYFPEELFTLGQQERFVDGGAYHGETIACFIRETGGSYHSIYAFEPDERNFRLLEKNVGDGKVGRLKLFQAGLYSENGEAGFNSLGNSGSFISETGGARIPMMKLDSMSEEMNPTYVKLDIEGAEAQALYGMNNLLSVRRPKLAVSIYHKAADLWELPLLIHSLNPSYRIHIRHYNKDLNETVCYAL